MSQKFQEIIMSQTRSFMKIWNGPKAPGLIACGF